MNKSELCAVILSYNRPNSISTIKTLRDHGYTGRILIVVDDKDPSLNEYIDKYKNDLCIFSKSQAMSKVDLMDNFQKTNTVLFARNVVSDIVRSKGYKYFLELDDDYNTLMAMFTNTLRFSQYAKNRRVTSFDRILRLYVRFLQRTNLYCICFMQCGDFIGGANSSYAKRICLSRKAMNAFICSVDRPFRFYGRMNDDVNMYLKMGMSGNLVMSSNLFAIHQVPTQANPGGLTEMYKEFGTYAKSFYSVMMAPSCVTVSSMGPADPRIHHKIKWDSACPKIVSEKLRKVNANE